MYTCCALNALRVLPLVGDICVNTCGMFGAIYERAGDGFSVVLVDGSLVVVALCPNI